jgi:hypothetical protein
VIIRDNGCDLGVEGHEIYGNRIIIHHLNPISLEDIERQSAYLLDTGVSDHYNSQHTTTRFTTAMRVY